ncbi:ROK family protein [Spongiactinospora rosea]|uniref:ROK family protein n=2 Tax=Spongiactinospora rosea TaxID=2248750 RepID=A0A366LZC1_9ACTN|nr:ROK family protein [Spongiactinospora rosea]
MVGAVDLGGTHVTAARIDTAAHRRIPGGTHGVPLRADGGRDELLAAITGAVAAAHTPAVRAWGLAVPGPFDYARGVALFEGVGKFESLYGVDLRAALADATGLAPGRFRFLNDADAFLLGEWTAGAARGHDRCAGLTLGTGVGSAFLAGGRVVDDGPGVPPEGRVDLLEYGGRPIEETFSRRALLAAYGAGDGFDVKDLIERARAGEPRALAVLGEAVGALGATVAPWLARFAPTALVVGGAIARGWEVLAPLLTPALADVRSLRLLTPTRLGDDAALLGAAHVAPAAP